MANFVLICGKTGTGKTTAIKTLDPKETAVLRVIKRNLPFRNAKQYVPGKNLFDASSWENVIKVVDWANKTPQIKHLVICDGTYIIRKEFFSKADEKGYEKFTELGIHMQQIITKIQSCRTDLDVFMEFHVENEGSDNGTQAYKAATVGKLLDEKYNIFENVDIILFSSPKYEAGGSTYGFYTNHTIDRCGIEVPAKSPEGMFSELYIDNDLQKVSDAIRKYYE